MIRQFKVKNRHIGFGRLAAMYTLLFAIIMGIIGAYFAVRGLSLVLGGDPVAQHLRALIYYGRWLRSLPGYLLREHRLPSFSYSIGLGSDILTTLHFYVIGDPLNLLSAFVPTAWMAYLYSALIVVRMYLSGLSFAWLCFETGRRNDKAVLAGCAMYTFSAYTIFAGWRHPFFLNPMICLPLVIAGAEKLRREGRHVPFILAVALSAVSNFYFFYMIAVFTVCFAVLRCVFIYGKDWKKWLSWLLRMLASSLTGVMLASFLLLPVLMAFINNPRSASGYIFDQMYPAGYYIRFLGSMFSFWAPGDYAYMGFPGIALAAFVVLFSVRDSNLMKYRAAFLIAAAGLCIPAAGYALNGFSYVTTRWIWAFTLIAAYVLVRVWDDMLTPGKVQVRALVICIAVLAVLSLHPSYAGSRINLWISLLAALIWLAAALFGVRHLSALTMLFVCGGVCVNCLFGLVTEWGGMAYGYRSYDRVAGENAEQFNTESAIIRRIEGTGDFYRYSGKGLSGNSSMQDGAPSTQFYWSLANGYVSDFFEEMGLCYSYGNAFAAFDDRTILNEIACVKDFYTQESEHVPYGYTLLGEDVNPAASEYPVYRNRFALSLGTMFSRIVGRTSYEALDPAERQEVLMYAVVADVEGAAEAAVSVVPDAEDAADVEDPTEAAEAAMTDVESTTEAVEAAAADEESTTEAAAADAESTTEAAEAAAADAESTTEAAAADAENAGGTAGTDMEDAAEGITLSRTVQEARISSPDGNIRIDDLTFTVQEDGAKLRVSFEGAPGSETYLYLQDIRYQAAKVPERVPFTVKAYCGKKKVMIRKLSWFTPREEWYVGRNSFLFNSGVQEKNVTSFILTFPFAGVYTFSDLQVYTQPVGEQYEQACAVLRGGALEDVDLHVTPDTTTWASARIDGSIDVDEPGMLLMQLACSGGWSARVDGKIVPVYRADTMFMGIMLEPGPHKITMYYETPGLKAGLLLTLAGLCILPVVKRKEKRRKRSED